MLNIINKVFGQNRIHFQFNIIKAKGCSFQLLTTSPFLYCGENNDTLKYNKNKPFVQGQNKYTGKTVPILIA